MPVIPTPMSADVFARIPAAMAFATGSLTAPWTSINVDGTPSHWVFDSFE